MIRPSAVAAAKWLALAYIVAIALITLWRADSLGVVGLALLFVPWIVGPAVLAAMGAKASRTAMGAWAFLLLEALIIAYTAWTWYQLMFVDHDAQNGIAVASIKGCRCYRRSPAGKGKPHRVLAELVGVDFGGRAVYYIPDLDVKEKTRAEVEKAAPQAAKWLIEKQNGTAYLARLPEGAEDLDKWLLSLEEHKRVTEFVKLTQTGITPKQWKGESPATPETGEAGDSTGTEPAKGGDRRGDGEEKESVNGASGNLLQHSSGTKHESDEQTGQSEDEQDQDKQTEKRRRQEYEEERRRIASKEQPQTSSTPKRQQPDPQPRRYKPIPKTNFGEFMVGLIYGGVAGIAFVMVMLFAAPELEPTSFIARVPAPISIVLGFIIAVVVLRIMVRRQYVRRWYALRDHLAGKQ